MNTTYPRFRSEAWLMLLSGMEAFNSVFKFEVPPIRAKGRTFLGDTIREVRSQEGVEIVPVDGPLIHRAGFLEKGFGARAHEDVAEMVQDAAGKKPRAIVLDIHSPGGSVTGTAETAAAIADAGRQCPVLAFSDGLCASAAYWLASQASAIYGTPSSNFGSIGAMLETISFARALDQAGIDPKVFQSSPLKGSGHPLLPLGEKNAEYLQNTVNTAGKMFSDAVRAKRPGVSAQAMDGRMFYAADAQRLGLIDGVVSSLSDVIGNVTGRRSGNVTGAPSGNVTGARSAAAVMEQAKAEQTAIQNFVRYAQAQQIKMNTSPENPNQSKMEALQVEGKFEEAYALLPAKEKAQFMGPKSYGSFMKAKARGRVHRNLH